MGERGQVGRYDEYYRDQLHASLEYQDFVADQLYSVGFSIGNYTSKKYQIERGENRAGVEIKYDKQFHETNNFWIELAEKSNPQNANYVPSGIRRQDNGWLYVIGNYKRIFIFSKSTLRLLAGRYKELENKTKTSIGFLFPVSDGEKYAAKIIEVL